MKSLKTWIQQLDEASAEDTTFFHEVICAIACSDDSDSTGAGSIKKGADIFPFFRDNVVIAKGPGAGEGTDITDFAGMKQYKFFDPTTKEYPAGEDPPDGVPELKSSWATEAHFLEKGMPARAADAIAVAKAVVKRIGKPTGAVYWTGPTNDSTDFGAADIAYNGQGISLKFGEGQFKNLTVNQFARAALGAGKETELLTELHNDVPEKWNQMTSVWLDLIWKSLNAWIPNRTKTNTPTGVSRDDALTEAIKLFGSWKSQTYGNWDKYQAKRISWEDVQVFHDLLFVPRKKKVYDKDDKKGDKDRVKQFRYVCRKILDQGPAAVRKKWKEYRNEQFTDIFGTYFDDRDETIKENLATIFEKQISVSPKPMIYASKGGTDVRRVPSKAEFDHSIEKISFSYEGKTTGAGYTFILLAQADPADPAEKIMEITIFFRWKSAGQMIGNPDTSSESEMYVTDYTDMFPEIAG
jgi:hypothetical protein